MNTSFQQIAQFLNATRASRSDFTGVNFTIGDIKFQRFQNLPFIFINDIDNQPIK